MRAIIVILIVAILVFIAGLATGSSTSTRFAAAGRRSQRDPQWRHRQGRPGAGVRCRNRIGQRRRQGGDGEGARAEVSEAAAIRRPMPTANAM